MIPRSMRGRRRVNRLVSTISAVSAAVGIFFLAWILFVVIQKGIGGLGLDFFTKLPAPPGIPGGGMLNALLGTLIITALATLAGVPIGMLAGVFLAEYGIRSRLREAVRFSSNVLMGTPSIIIGVFIYAMLVEPAGHFSGFSGAAALAVIMLPVVARTTEDMLQLVPNTLRESALALAAPRWKVTIDIVFRAAKSGLLTGVLLAIARVSGETAPLLFTALNSPYWIDSLNEPTANLTVTIFNYAMSPYPDWQQLAWGASLLITGSILIVTIISRMTLDMDKKRKQS
jgi:phosphate transport system permease protein